MPESDSGQAHGDDAGLAAEVHSTAAWRSRDFRIYQASRVLAVVGSEAQSVGVAWQVYQLTHSALALGYTGLALFLPGLVFVLPAGHIADRFDRRRILLGCYTGQVLASAALLWLALASRENRYSGAGAHPQVSIWWVYLVLFLIGTGRAFSGPAASAMVPTLVPKPHFVNAVTWGATVFQVSNATGPMLGGLLFTLPLVRWLGSRGTPMAGAPLVYCFTLACLLGYLLLVLQLVPHPAAAGGSKKGFTLQTAFAGLKYVLHTRLLLGSISLDLFAVLFGGATALLPIFAQDILHSGPSGLGLLRAMPSVGALLVSVTLLWLPLRRRAGRTMLWCVGAFGLATVVFGLSRNLWLSCAALFVTGATDMVSVVVRSSILQLATPDDMRGRVSAVNWLFLGASNEFGEYESGLTAHWMGAVRAVVFGGAASMTVVALWSAFFPALRHADRLTAESLMAVERELSEVEPAP